jgi:hypothetical protein
MDPRTLSRYVEAEPFVARVHPRLLLVERAAFDVWWQARCTATVTPAGAATRRVGKAS